MSSGGTLLRRLCALTAIAGVLCFATAASGAVDLTTSYSEDIAKAVFAKHYNTVWTFIEPSYRKGINKARWQRCVSALVRESGSYHLKSIKVSGTKRLHSVLPLLGPVVLIDVSLQVLYTEPGSRTLQAGALYAYWVKQKGVWHAVWLPTQLSAYRAGKCSPASLY
jgi:hypothetical protein